MLRLTYLPTDAGAPSQYGTAQDRLLAENGAVLQAFPKARPDFAAPDQALADAVDAWLSLRGDRAGPMVVMVHGYLFDPATAADVSPSSPFGSIYGLPPRTDYHLSWLPLVGECDRNGQNKADNAIAFTYRSQAGILEVGNACWTNSYQYAVFDLAPLAARALATVLAHLGAKPELRVHILAHSLGTRTVSQAIGQLRGRMPVNLKRVVLLDGAEFCVDAAHNFSGCAFDVINIANRQDEVLRVGAEKYCSPARPLGVPSCVIGYEGLGGNDRWLDLTLENRKLAEWLAAARAPTNLPYTINPRAEEDSHAVARLAHWSCYTNDGNRALVRDLLLDDAMTVDQLRERGIPAGTASLLYGQFNGHAVPPTPQSNSDRQLVLAQASFNQVA